MNTVPAQTACRERLSGEAMKSLLAKDADKSYKLIWRKAPSLFESLRIRIANYKEWQKYIEVLNSVDRK